MSEHRFKFLERDLGRRQKENRLRGLRVVTPLGGALVEVDGKTLVNFSSNDYLGLSMNSRLKERAAAYIDQYGAGSPASRLVCGNYPFFEEVEEKLARLKQKAAALLLNSGFQANVSYIPSLANRRSLILADRLSHNSIIQGALLARCRFLRFAHNDLNHLASLLQKHAGGHSRVLIITETVFSMDGDCCDLDGLVELARRYNAILIADEAHATGVFGPQGMGLCCGKDVDLVMGTFGKGCGAFGAYLATSSEIKNYMVNYCPGFIYTTALPPAVLGAVSAALDLLPTMEKERRHLLDLAQYLRDSLQGLGFSTCESASQIIPVMAGSDQDCVNLAGWLEKNGFLAVAIRPPTVERGRARIRLTLSAQHSYQQVDDLINAFRRWTR